MPRFCQRCGEGLAPRLLEGEGRERLSCAACGFVHYVNPRLVVGVIPEHGGRGLLVRRAIEPSRGLWTFPGGYLEMGETAEEGAEREALEEVGLRVRAQALLGAYSLVEAGNVIVVFRGSLVSRARTEPFPGPETIEAAWFGPDEVPWQELAFATTEAALRDWARLTEPRSRRGRRGR
ncbi:MAG TPA: NUDIX hydrolase [Dehalococcoidia bacterium]